MRAILGVVSMVIALAIVGVLALKQLRATGQIAGAAPPATAAGASDNAVPATTAAQARQLQQRVQADVAAALAQGAASRAEDAQK